MVNHRVSGYILCNEIANDDSSVAASGLFESSFKEIPMSGLLGEILVESGEISTEQLYEALEFQKENGGLIGEILVGLGYIQDEELRRHLKNQWKYKAEAGAISPD